jgi:2-polyprenyl-6-methoxyphenol hydroxylase-like FAD-dependent oxidoreductase
VLALLLGRKGIPITVVDAAAQLDEQPRATHYNSPATHVLKRAGVLDEIRAAGVLSRRVVWRKPDGTLLAGLDLTSIPDESSQRMVALPLNQVSRIVMRHLQAIPCVQILWGHNVVSVGQDEGKAWVDVETSEGSTRFEADYVVGCDGANSKVRRAVLGETNFPGKTWDEQIVATNVSPFQVESLFVVLGNGKRLIKGPQF